MNINLDYVNALTLLMPQEKETHLTLVGCGGTGSWLAPAVARVGKLLSQSQGVQIVFIDPDTVEPKNIIRQNFCAAEIGRPKAMALAERYSSAWGIPITSRVERYTAGVSASANIWSALSVVIGCVDSAGGRQEIRKSFENRDKSGWWLDCGNEKSYGQILLGGGATDKKLIFKLAGYCAGLPLPSDQHPELVEEKPAPVAPALSCAEMAMADSQGLAINQRVAAEAADYLVRMLITRDLKKYATYMDLESGTTRSKYISGDLIPGAER